MTTAFKNKTVFIIAGPTAVGKTSVAISLAQQLNTEIISADSRQCFKELNIGVARPSLDELKKIQHHFIASHSIVSADTDKKMHAAVFEKFALQKTEELFLKHDRIVMTGGTGLYIKAFCDSMDDIPEVDPILRERLKEGLKNNGLAWLQKEVEQKDPRFYAIGEIQNPQRLMRALEVFESSGKSILEFRKGEKIKRDFNIIKIGLELPKEELHQRINQRVEQMMKGGLIDEVKKVLPYRNENALRTVGYKEIFSFLDNEISLEEAIELIKRNTRKYAKRQMTWFKKDLEFVWFSPIEIEKIISYSASNTLS